MPVTIEATHCKGIIWSCGDCGTTARLPYGTAEWAHRCGQWAQLRWRISCRLNLQAIMPGERCCNR